MIVGVFVFDLISHSTPASLHISNRLKFSLSFSFFLAFSHCIAEVYSSIGPCGSLTSCTWLAAYRARRHLSPPKIPPTTSTQCAHPRPFAFINSCSDLSLALPWPSLRVLDHTLSGSIAEPSAPILYIFVVFFNFKFVVQLRPTNQQYYQ